MDVSLARKLVLKIGKSLLEKIDVVVVDGVGHDEDRSDFATSTKRVLASIDSSRCDKTVENLEFAVMNGGVFLNLLNDRSADGSDSLGLNACQLCSYKKAESKTYELKLCLELDLLDAFLGHGFGHVDHLFVVGHAGGRLA